MNSSLPPGEPKPAPNLQQVSDERNAKQPTSSLCHRVMDAPEAKPRAGHIPPDDVHRPYIKIKSAPLIRMAMARPIIPRERPEVSLNLPHMHRCFCMIHVCLCSSTLSLNQVSPKGDEQCTSLGLWLRPQMRLSFE